MLRSYQGSATYCSPSAPCQKVASNSEPHGIANHHNIRMSRKIYQLLGGPRFVGTTVEKTTVEVPDLSLKTLCSGSSGAIEA